MPSPPPCATASRKASKPSAQDPNIDAIVLIGGGRTFIAGADIREFGKPPAGANLNDVIATMENCPKIVVAALHGTPLGGGLETALGAHYRVSLPTHPRRPAGSASRPAARRRRHAAPAAPHRRQVRARRHPLGPPHPRARSQEQGHRRRASSKGDLLAGAVAHAQMLVAQNAPRRRVRDLDGDARIARPVRGDREGDRPPRPRLQGAVEHHQVRAGRRRAAVRRGHQARARAVRRAADLAGVGGAALLLLRRARGRQGARRAGRHAAARDQDRRHHRRRHDGRRHRHELRQCRHPGDAPRGEAGSARPRPQDHPHQLREHRQARRHEGRGRRQAHGADHADAQLRRPQGRRRRHRGGVRDDGSEGRRLQAARRGRQAGRDPGHQHLGPRRQPDRHLHQAAGRRDRHALLLAGQRHEAARERARQGDRARTSSPR